MKHLSAAVLLLAPLVAVAPPAWAGSPSRTAFTLTSTDLRDNGILATASSGAGKSTDGSECGGENVSPALMWKNKPAGTQSFAITMYDPDGAAGSGVSHWVAYDIPASASHFERGEGSKPGNYVGGTNQRKMTTYFGPCGPKGDAYHHYTIQIFALSIAPGTLKPGLTRAELFSAISGHVLAETSLIARYTR
jgi:Raf kinase inhibitor-like YbhB/YbcL family protein